MRSNSGDTFSAHEREGAHNETHEFRSAVYFVGVVKSQAANELPDSIAFGVEREVPVARTFGIVDLKVAEADFFLRCISENGSDFHGIRCYTSAFVTSARSVTYAMQAVLRHTSGFNEWYAKRQKHLKEEPLARFFTNYRTVNHHVGDNFVNAGTYGQNTRPLYWFTPTMDLPIVPHDDVETACRNYLKLLLEIVFQCYLDLGPEIDAHQYYTEDHFASIGKTIEDADQEVFGVRGWTAGAGFGEQLRWRLIRDSVVGCEINHLFMEYLGKIVPRPERPPRA